VEIGDQRLIDTHNFERWMEEISSLKLASCVWSLANGDGAGVPARPGTRASHEVARSLLPDLGLLRTVPDAKV
jgi:hypothetical protein